MIKEARTLFSGQYAHLLPVFSRLYALFEEEDCAAYVKTHYVGFSLPEGSVAAAHPHEGSEIELALALPENHTSKLLHDASHLKWRSLPLAVTIRDDATFESAVPLIYEAISRMRHGSHDVQLDNARFKGRGSRFIS